jgi:hypothetical protein
MLLIYLSRRFSSRKLEHGSLTFGNPMGRAYMMSISTRRAESANQVVNSTKIIDNARVPMSWSISIITRLPTRCGFAVCSMSAHSPSYYCITYPLKVELRHLNRVSRRQCPFRCCILLPISLGTYFNTHPSDESLGCLLRGFRISSYYEPAAAGGTDIPSSTKFTASSAPSCASSRTTLVSTMTRLSTLYADTAMAV